MNRISRIRTEIEKGEAALSSGSVQVCVIGKRSLVTSGIQYQPDDEYYRFAAGNRYVLCQIATQGAGAYSPAQGPRRNRHSSALQTRPATARYQRGTSNRSDQWKLPFPKRVRGEPQRLPHILWFQIGIGCENRIIRHSIRHHPYHGSHRNAESPDAWNAPHPLRVHSNSLESHVRSSSSTHRSIIHGERHERLQVLARHSPSYDQKNPSSQWPAGFLVPSE